VVWSPQLSVRNELFHLVSEHSSIEVSSGKARIYSRTYITSLSVLRLRPRY